MKKDDYLSKLNDEIIERIDSAEELMAITGGSNIVCLNYVMCPCDTDASNCDCTVDKECFSCLNQSNCSCKDKGCTIWGVNYIYSQCTSLNNYLC